MKSIKTFLEEFHCIPLEEKPMILLQAWFKFFAIKHDQPENSNELFQTLLEDLQIMKKELIDCNHPTFFDENSSKEITSSSSNQEKDGPPQDSDIRQLIREECSVEVSEELKQNMEDTILELAEICRQKELICMHDNVDDLIESTLDSKLLSINSQRLDNKEQEVENVVEQLAERGNHEIIKSGVKELVPILSENEVTSEDKRECDVLVCEDSSTFDVCDNHSDVFSNSKNDDDISYEDDDFEDVEYVEASLSNPEIVSVEEENGVEEENVVYQEEEEVDLGDISQIQDVDLCEKLWSITRLISNIESLNDNLTPDRLLNSSVSIPIFEETDNSISDTFSPEFETFCDHTEETRSNITTHADDSLLEYDSFCFEIEPNQERLINIMKNDFLNDSSNDPLLEEADLFLSDNSIPPGIENFPNDSERDICFLEELLIDDSILSHESSDSNFEENPSVPLPPPKPPDAETDAGEEIPAVMNDKDEDIDYYSFMFSKVFSFLLFAESTIFEPSISV
nr:hypothetical protein [Tanacetum cinerariifolium]